MKKLTQISEKWDEIFDIYDGEILFLITFGGIFVIALVILVGIFG